MNCGLGQMEKVFKVEYQYDVIECSLGTKNLKAAVNSISEQGWEIVSVVENHGGSFVGIFGSGASLGFLIVVKCESE